MEPISISDPRYVELARTITDDQRALLLGAADEAKKLGATSHQLAPLYALVYVDHRPLSPEQTEALEAHVRQLGLLEDE